MTVESPYGMWKSPFTAQAVASAAGGPSWPSVVGSETWWCASHTPTASIRLLRCAEPAGPRHDVLGGEWKVSNGAIGYGGRPYLAVAGNEQHLVVFTHAGDGRLYAARVVPLAAGPSEASAPVPLTPRAPSGCAIHYADPILGPDGSEVWCVRETMRPSEVQDQDPAELTTRDIVAVPLSGAAADAPEAIRVVARSHDFLSGIRLSPDGSRLAWIGWNHPVMPWDSSELMVAQLVEGRAVNPVRVLGGDEVSVPQAEWADARVLYAMADPTGWWNLHRITLRDPDGASDGDVEVERVLPMDRECAHALWRVGATSFAVTAAGVVLWHGVGEQRLALWNPSNGELTPLAEDWREFAVGLSGDARSVAVVAASPTERPTPLRVTVPDNRVVRCEPRRDTALDPWQSRPERRSVPGPDGRAVHFSYYPPTNPDYHGPAGTPPPLIIDVHGGPTSYTGAARSLTFSLFCSRGYAVASVDYGGSTGYGRAYRNLLLRAWGIVDVEDCVTVARALAEAGLADPRRTAIRGGSAGGWTSLAALASTDVFCCGAVYYPISDPLTWFGGQTHDFESRYIQTLVGELPRDKEHFSRVSPLAHACDITVPFVMLQGLDDGICHPDQARRVVEAVEAARGSGLCRAFLLFPGEGHGFRLEKSIAAALDAELALFEDVMVAR